MRETWNKERTHQGPGQAQDVVELLSVGQGNPATHTAAAEEFRTRCCCLGDLFMACQGPTSLRHPSFIHSAVECKKIREKNEERAGQKIIGAI